MTGSAQIIRGDALALPLADSSVDLVVTSPPYFALRSYQDGGEHYAGQLGSEATPAEFVDALIAATAEMVRVLKPSGSIWVNLGDKYAQDNERSRNGNGNRKHIENFSSGSVLREPTVTLGRKDNGVSRKSLIGIPWRYALRCIDDLGLILRAEVIWSKPNGLPESVTDRVRRSHETWFHFTTQPRYFSAVDEIREPALYPLDARHLRGGRRSVNPDGTDAGGNTSTCNPLGKLPGSVWTIPTEPLTVPDHLGIDHFAAFPTEWPRRIIQGWSPSGVCVECGEARQPVTVKDAEGRAMADSWGGASPDSKYRRDASFGLGVRTFITGYGCACWHSIPGEWWESDGAPQRPRRAEPPTTPGVVLDPFGGTGTTALVAKALGRHGISVDMSADYCRLATWRTTDPDQLAKAARVEKPPKQIDGQLGFDLEIA